MSDLARGLWAHLQDHYGTRVVAKDRSWWMAGAGRALEWARILDARDFQERFTTVVGTTIYVPFEVGVPSGSHSLWQQVVIAVHEHQHVEQARRDRFPVFAARYLASRSARALYEAEAYTTDLQLSWARNRHMASPRRVASILSHYGVRASDIEAAERYLTRAARRIRSGQIVTPAAERALAWLEARPGDWRAEIR